MCEQCYDDKELFPDLNDKEYLEVLWGLTCFPMGDPHKMLVEIAERRAEGWTWDKIYERQLNEMTELLKSMKKDEQNG